jgi:hypothetical protein
MMFLPGSLRHSSQLRHNSGSRIEGVRNADAGGGGRQFRPAVERSERIKKKSGDAIKQHLQTQTNFCFHLESLN